MSRTVLHIDDNASIACLVERLLKRRPHTEVRQAANARDGLRLAIDERPDLILLDNGLPDATGGEILRQLASSEATAKIPVIIISGASAAVGDELLAMGAAEFVRKPFDIHQFMTVIDRYLP